MAHYAVGDIQGCLSPLQCLLEHVAFDPVTDVLWCAGDLVNRGPKSLETLRFIKSLGSSAKVVLGNHDLHLLAIAYADKNVKKSDTLHSVLQAPDKDELLHWLKAQPLIQQDTVADIRYTLTHAGIAPYFNTHNIAALADEVHQCLIGKGYQRFLQQMYGDEPAIWHDDLQGMERLRFITNAFTRMRYIDTRDESLNMLEKKSPTSIAPNSTLSPWFNQLHSSWHTDSQRIIFGHWASLEGQCSSPNIHALDTGCAWGGKLSLLRLGNNTLTQCDCSPMQKTAAS